MGAVKNYYHDEICAGAAEPEALEYLVHDIWQDARLLACAPAHSIRANKAEIEEARECLNDALAKAERKIAA